MKSQFPEERPRRKCQGPQPRRARDKALAQTTTNQPEGKEKSQPPYRDHDDNKLAQIRRSARSGPKKKPDPKKKRHGGRGAAAEMSGENPSSSSSSSSEQQPWPSEPSPAEGSPAEGSPAEPSPAEGSPAEPSPSPASQQRGRQQRGRRRQPASRTAAARGAAADAAFSIRRRRQPASRTAAARDAAADAAFREGNPLSRMRPLTRPFVITCGTDQPPARNAAADAAFWKRYDAARPPSGPPGPGVSRANAAMGDAAADAAFREGETLPRRPSAVRSVRSRSAPRKRRRRTQTLPRRPLTRPFASAFHPTFRTKSPVRTVKKGLPTP